MTYYIDPLGKILAGKDIRRYTYIRESIRVQLLLPFFSLYTTLDTETLHTLVSRHRYTLKPLFIYDLHTLKPL